MVTISISHGDGRYNAERQTLELYEGTSPEITILGDGSITVLSSNRVIANFIVQSSNLKLNFEGEPLVAINFKTTAATKLVVVGLRSTTLNLSSTDEMLQKIGYVAFIDCKIDNVNSIPSFKIPVKLYRSIVKVVSLEYTNTSGIECHVSAIDTLEYKGFHVQGVFYKCYVGLISVLNMIYPANIRFYSCVVNHVMSRLKDRLDIELDLQKTVVNEITLDSATLVMFRSHIPKINPITSVELNMVTSVISISGASKIGGAIKDSVIIYDNLTELPKDISMHTEKSYISNILLEEAYNEVFYRVYKGKKEKKKKRSTRKDGV